MSTSTSLGTITTSSIGDQKATLLMLNILSLVRPIFFQVHFQRLQPGAGGKNAYSRNEENVARNEAMGMELHYFTDHYGFSYFSISNTEIEVKFVGADGATIYQYTRGEHQSARTLSPNLFSCFKFHAGKHQSGVNHKF